MSLVEQIFQCTRCGFCCHGETTVSLDATDQRRMVAWLGLAEEEVRRRYWRLTGDRVQMRTEAGHCIFYHQGCTVHPGRPRRCAQWPLHPAILGDENSFHSIAESCPGIKKELGYSEFCRILRLVLEQRGGAAGEAGSAGPER
jgi:uncharacterized protein